MHPSRLLRAVLIAGALATVGAAAGIAAAAAAPGSSAQTSAQTTTAQPTTPKSTTPKSTTPKSTTPKSTMPKSTPPNGHHCPHMGSGSNGSAYTGPEGGADQRAGGRRLRTGPDRHLSVTVTVP